MSNTEENSNRDLDDLKELDEQSAKNLAGNIDQVILNHILESDKNLETGRNSTFKNPNVVWQPTNKFRVAMIMAPAWSILFPPYGVAKLTGLLRTYEYSVKAYDINVEAYHYFLNNLGKDYWLSIRHYLWAIESNFKKYIFPDLKHILDKHVNDILNSDVRVVGFSIYVTNRFASAYMAREIRKARPDICIIAGGPETITNIKAFTEGGDSCDLYNYIIQGEAEDNLIYVLENLPDTLPMNEVIGDIKSRLKLEEYPYADYSDYDIRNYKEHGVNVETSRGCIAQCSFCTETYFWKFRSQDPVRVADEIEHYVKTYKMRRLWFVDSLANGNLKNFERLIDLLLEKKLNIRWHTMARCDGRMDYIFIRKAVAAGCTALAFGVESGSQKVLDDMRKKVDVWEVESNIRDCKKAGMWNHVTWMIGFPTEEAIDYFHSIQIFYNIRKWLACVTLGSTCLMSPNSDIENNCRKYGIVNEGNFFNHEQLFLNCWYTEGYKSTILHRFARLKFTYVWLEILKDHRGSLIDNTQYEGSMKEHYTFTPGKMKDIPEYVEQDFNVNFNQFEGFSGSLVNEYVGFCFLLYKYFNRCTFTFNFDPEVDLNTFGDFLVKDYKCNIYFDVNKKGEYTLIVDHELSHSTKDENLKAQYEKERNVRDMSFKEKIERKGHISEWQTSEPQIRETIHEQYRKK